MINNFLKYKALCQKCKHDEYFAKFELHWVMGMLLLTPSQQCSLIHSLNMQA